MKTVPVHDMQKIEKIGTTAESAKGNFFLTIIRWSPILFPFFAHTTSVVDLHRFDADPDPDLTFHHFDAGPDTNPDPTISSTLVRNFY